MQAVINDKTHGTLAKLAQHYSVSVQTMLETIIGEWLELHATDFAAYESLRDEMEVLRLRQQAELEKIRAMMTGKQNAVR